MEKSPIELIQDDPLIDTGKANLKSFAIHNLQSFGIYTWHDLSSPLKSLSVGCRRKAQLCQIIMRKSSILILDEPTNHIDFPSLESIKDSLLNFPGIIIAATHDRYFTEKLATKLLICWIIRCEDRELLTNVVFVVTMEKVMKVIIIT